MNFTRDFKAVYHAGATLPDLVLTWEDDEGEVIPFASGYTFALTVTPHDSETPSFPKSSGIIGADTDPNVTISWAATGEIGGLTPGDYDLEVLATRTADGRVRVFQGRIRVRP